MKLFNAKTRKLEEVATSVARHRLAQRHVKNGGHWCLPEEVPTYFEQLPDELFGKAPRPTALEKPNQPPPASSRNADEATGEFEATPVGQVQATPASEKPRRQRASRKRTPKQ